ncbi:MAG: hypothetical protein KAI43_08600 [Candidatus Aureabacteria bacterium]|nr:hypothetical protein [Candidatus Auribacterota bacterium]
MKKIIFTLLICFLIVPVVVADNSWLDIFNQGSQSNRSGYECPSCRYQNKSNANYCAGCGAKLTSSTNSSYSQNVYCPHCHRNFGLNTSNTIALCQNCGARNKSNSSFCVNCGRKLNTDQFFVNCPHCRQGFDVSLSHSSNPSIRCTHCKRWYGSNNSSCPGCTRQKSSHNPIVKKHSSQVLIASFTKANYDKKVGKYNVSAYTGGRSFSKIIVDVNITEKHAIIINTIKVYYNGAWHPYAQNGRLSQGKNIFNVPIPQGASDVVFSFAHGRGSQVKVFLE